MYYQQPNKTLEEGLVLISSDQDILDMVACHMGHNMIVIYTVKFGEKKNKNASEKKKGTVGKGKNVMVEQEESSSDSDPFWAVVVSGEEDVFEGDGNHETMHTGLSLGLRNSRSKGIRMTTWAVILQTVRSYCPVQRT